MATKAELAKSARIRRALLKETPPAAPKWKSLQARDLAWCSHGSHWRPAEQLQKHKSCDSCREKSKARSAANPEYFRQYNAAHRPARRAYSNAYYARRPLEEIMLMSAKARAKKFAVPFDLTVADIQIPELCPILGMPLTKGTEKKACHASPSLDRLQPELGYVRGNVCVISNKANVIKNFGTKADHEAIARWMGKQGLS